jgi:hypothetical protein
MISRLLEYIAVSELRIVMFPLGLKLTTNSVKEFPFFSQLQNQTNYTEK